MKKIKIPQNPYLLFLPVLIALIIYILINPTNGTGDEARYMWYAKNMIHGFYSPPAPNVTLTNGPGYPMVLIPFILLKLPLISMTIINAFFYYLSIIFFFKALKETVSYPMTLLFSFGWACYYIAFQNLPYILTEPFTYFLISVLIYSMVKAFNPENKARTKFLIITGIVLGYIVLTKMIFGHILVFMLIGSALFWIFSKNKLHFRKMFIISSIALLMAIPYLIYTYSLTGRLFYWGFGNDTLYCMSTPYEGEYGDYKRGLGINKIEDGNYNIQGADSILKAHHQAEYDIINKYTGIERDDVYKKIAIQNIKEHPLKFIENIVYNVGRLIFHYPFSHAVQRPKILLVFPINGAILTLMIFSLIPTFINWRKIPAYLQFLLILTLLYLGASAIVTAYVRMFTIIVPILLFWIAFIVQNTLKFSLKFDIRSNRENRSEI
jgi:hypothetical protein